MTIVGWFYLLNYIKTADAMIGYFTSVGESLGSLLAQLIVNNYDFFSISSNSPFKFFPFVYLKAALLSPN